MGNAISSDLSGVLRFGGETKLRVGANSGLDSTDLSLEEEAEVTAEESLTLTSLAVRGGSELRIDQGEGGSGGPTVTVDGVATLSDGAGVTIEGDGAFQAARMTCGSNTGSDMARLDLGQSGHVTVDTRIVFNRCMVTGGSASRLTLAGSSSGEVSTTTYLPPGTHTVATLEMRGDANVRTRPGEVRVAGAVDVGGSAALVVDRGSLDVEDELRLGDSAHLMLNGVAALGAKSLTLGASTTYRAVFASPAIESDSAALSVRQTATFGGTLVLAPRVGISQGDEFVIAKYAARSGEFASLEIDNGGVTRKRATSADDWTVTYGDSQTTARYDGEDAQTAPPTPPPTPEPTDPPTPAPATLPPTPPPTPQATEPPTPAPTPAPTTTSDSDSTTTTTTTTTTTSSGPSSSSTDSSNGVATTTTTTDIGTTTDTGTTTAMPSPGAESDSDLLPSSDELIPSSDEPNLIPSDQSVGSVVDSVLPTSEADSDSPSVSGASQLHVIASLGCVAVLAVLVA